MQRFLGGDVKKKGRTGPRSRVCNLPTLQHVVDDFFVRRNFKIWYGMSQNRSPVGLWSFGYKCTVLNEGALV